MFIFTSFQKAIQRATLEMLYKLCFIVLDCIPPNASIILKISINLPFDCIVLHVDNTIARLDYFFISFTIDIIIIHPYMIIIITHIHGSSKTFMNELLKMKK